MPYPWGVRRTNVFGAMSDTLGRWPAVLAALAAAATLGCRPEPLPFERSTPPSGSSAESPAPTNSTQATTARPVTSPVDTLERKYGGSAFYVPEHQIVLWYGGLRPPHPWDGKMTHDDEPAADVYGFEIHPEGVGLVSVDAEVPAPLLGGGFSGDSATQFLIGEGDNKPSDRVRRYDLLEGSVEELPPLPAPRLGAAIGEGPDGPWVLGGFAEGSLRDDVLHLVDGGWTTMSDRLPQSTVGGMLQVRAGRVILWNADSNKSTKQHLVRKADAPGWHAVSLPDAPFEGGRFGDGATLVGVGGEVFALPGPWQPAHTSVVFDPATDALRKIPPYPAQCGHDAAKAVVVGERVLVLGVVLDLGVPDEEVVVQTCWLDPANGQLSVADRVSG